MQDPICAMKILRRPKFRVPNRNLVRPELRAAWRHECGDMSAATWLISSIHNLRQTHAVASPHAPRRLVGIALMSAAVAVQWNERVSTYVC